MGVSFNTLNSCVNVKFRLENTSFLDKVFKIIFVVFYITLV